MKISWILLFFLSIYSSCYYAQRFRAGISAGMSTAQYDGDGYSGYNKLGLSTGLFLKKDFSEKWAMQFEIIYVQKGSIRNPKPDKNDLNQYSLKLDYIDVPLLVKYNYKKLFVLEGGIGLGVLVKDEEINNYLDVTGIRPFHKTELSFNLGINYTIVKNLDINWRYTYSILPVRPYVASVTYRLNLGESNNIMTFTLKYTLGKQKKNDQ